MEIEDHYALLLGINTPWSITSVNLDMPKHQVDVEIEFTGEQALCPECGQLCPRHDNRQTRTWRHLDTMQFTTLIHCEVPRSRCKTHGVKTIDTPWATKNSRFTLLFESFAVRVLLAARSTEEARKLLQLNWHQVDAIKTRAVERGLAKRKHSAIKHVGIDEKQFRKGHVYISSLVDLDQGRVLDVVEERTETAAKQLITQALDTRQRQQVQAVALDMWPAYANAVTELLPKANIVHDRFHISQHLNEAVDQVRRKENKILLATGDDRLKGTKFLWLTNPENQDSETLSSFKRLKHSNLKVARAWAIKEQLRDFWGFKSRYGAKRYFNRWYSWAIRSRLAPIKAKARMVKRHLVNVLNYFKHRISNAVAEGLNSKIQMIKSNARGFRSFTGFRTSILFYCGKLELLP